MPTPFFSTKKKNRVVMGVVWTIEILVGLDFWGWICLGFFVFELKLKSAAHGTHDMTWQ